MVLIHLSKKAWSGIMIRARGRQSIPKVLIGFGRHLVYTEGTKTEPLYVTNLKEEIAKHLNVSERQIEIITVTTKKSKHTLELVEYAKKDVQERRHRGETVDFVWIFYDKDSYDDFDDTYKAIFEMNNKHDGKDDTVPCDSFDTSWFACWSNECFEVWAYHYFENLITPLPREDYIKKINQFLKKNGCKQTYEKNLENLHSFLTNNGGSIDKAIKLMKSKDVPRFKKPNPSSGIYQFAEYICAYLSKSNSN